MNSHSRNDEFLELLEAHQSQLLGMIYALVRNMSDAEDLYQQTTIVMWKKFDTYTVGTNFVAWAKRIAKLEVLNFFRKNQMSLPSFSEELVSVLIDNPHATNASQIEDRHQALVACMKTLREKDETLIDLRYGKGKAILDIAKTLNRSRQSIGNSLKRIRLALFECINRRLLKGGE